jgi:NAD(P)-dependent dehydrogenase (short-subunit alcohol dehydrogenase family)
MTKNKWTTDRIESQDGRVVMITGANTGIGYEAAFALAQKGARVVLACRDKDKAENALQRIKAEQPAAEVAVGNLDLSSLASVRAFADDFLKQNDRLDLLINNAGVMIPPKTLTADGFELQFGTNHLGHFALTGRLLERLLSTTDSRVVNVASAAHNAGKMNFDDLQWEKRPYKKMASYGQSKLANLLFTYELQRRLEAAGSTTITTAAHPGWTGTDLQRHSLFIRMMNPLFSMPPWQGALPTLYAATSTEAHGGDYIGPDGFAGMKGYPTQVKSNTESYDLETAQKLWDVSEALTGVRFDW